MGVHGSTECGQAHGTGNSARFLAEDRQTVRLRDSPREAASSRAISEAWATVEMGIGGRAHRTGQKPQRGGEIPAPWGIGLGKRRASPEAGTGGPGTHRARWVN